MGKGYFITGEEIAGLAEILEDENYELGPQDRRLLLLLVKMFLHGLGKSKHATDEPDIEPEQEHYEARGAGCMHCLCFSQGEKCCECGAEPGG